jgi:hypothetical protein
VVIAMQDAKEGLIFWHSADSFGVLEISTIYSEAEGLKQRSSHCR